MTVPFLDEMRIEWMNDLGYKQSVTFVTLCAFDLKGLSCFFGIPGWNPNNPAGIRRLCLLNACRERRAKSRE